MIGFPLLLIPLAICNIIVFLMPGVSFAAPLFTLTLMSGVAWPVTLSDVLIALGILLLLFEVIKGARPGAKYFMDHLLSLVVFSGAAAEFVMLPQFGTSTYFLLTMLALVDFLSGIALRARRRLAPADAPVNKRQRNIETEEPRLDPEPAPPVPPAATVAESVLLDRPQPTTPHPAVDATGSSPEIRSPGLQPNDGAHPSPDAPPR
ncbi:MAG TPA: hypothetical protein VGO49_08030 [Bradyrhizobium sp.]|nr:hypothetical protein [Bradyrhizobium sp.]